MRLYAPTHIVLVCTPSPACAAGPHRCDCTPQHTLYSCVHHRRHAQPDPTDATVRPNTHCTRVYTIAGMRSRTPQMRLYAPTHIVLVCTPSPACAAGPHRCDRTP